MWYLEWRDGKVYVGLQMHQSGCYCIAEMTASEATSCVVLYCIHPWFPHDCSVLCTRRYITVCHLSRMRQIIRSNLPVTWCLFTCLLYWFCRCLHYCTWYFLYGNGNNCLLLTYILTYVRTYLLLTYLLMYLLTYLCTYILTYAMEQSPSWDADWFLASQ